MNYYPFHIGDYLSATRHLSWDEDAAYRRLLDACYTTEKPLPLDIRAVCRLVLATTEVQREAVRVVLDEFFEETPEGWVNRRVGVEIDAMREKQQRQRERANKRWQKQSTEPGNAEAMPRHTESDATASPTDASALPPTPTPTPTPTPKKEHPSGVGAKPRAARKPPADFALTPEMVAWAAEKTPAIDTGVETEKFRDHTFANPISDWPGAWRNWMRKASELRAAGRRPPPPDDIFAGVR